MRAPIALMAIMPLLIAAPLSNADPSLRPICTYSIVARDPATGQLGVAVQSHWFSVGPVVPWAKAGVGAVATQSFAEPACGPQGLDLMRLGTRLPASGLLPQDQGLTDRLVQGMRQR